MKSHLVYGVLAFGMLCCTPLAYGESIAVSFTPSDVTANFVDGNNRVVGWEFTPDAAISVTSLGFYDADQNGLEDSHAVGIYTLSGMLIASATVPSGTAATLDGVFRFVNLGSPVALDIGSTYVISALLQGDGDGWVWWPQTAGVNVTDPVVDPAITLGGNGTARFDCCSVTALQFPSQEIGTAFPGDQRIAFVGPNFGFAATSAPEPATLPLILLCGGMLFFGFIPSSGRKRLCRPGGFEK